MKRDTGLDVTRIVAFCSVVGVHFFKCSGFYNLPVSGEKMFLMVIVRNMFMICVPLFLLLTGYLMSGKQYNIEKDYLKHVNKLKSTLVTYLAATIMILLYLKIFEDAKITLKSGMLNILSYSQYAWYVNMYIGLYLMIPFLNIIWNGLETKRARRIVVGVFASLTILPGVFNIYDFSGWNTVLHPYLSANYNQIVPNWWKGIYPITYYFVGAYIRKDVSIKKLSTVKLILLWMVSVLVFGAYNVWRSYSINYVWGPWCDWNSLQNTVNTVLIFLIINSLHYEQVPARLKKTLGFVSGLTFGAYLLSFIADSMNYPKLVEHFPKMFDRFLRLPVIVGINICIALALSFCVQLLISGMSNSIRFLNKEQRRTGDGKKID